MERLSSLPPRRARGRAGGLLLLNFGPEPLVLLVEDARRATAAPAKTPMKTSGLSKFAPNPLVLPMGASHRSKEGPCDTTATSRVVTDRPLPAGAVPIAEDARRTDTETQVGLGTGQGGGRRGSLPWRSARLAGTKAPLRAQIR